MTYIQPPLPMIFVRHGHADQAAAGQDDMQRQLSQRGQKMARSSREQLETLLIQSMNRGLQLSSPAARCVSTSMIGGDARREEPAFPMLIPELHFDPIIQETDDPATIKLLEADKRILTSMFHDVLGYAPLQQWLAIPRVAAAMERMTDRAVAAIMPLLEKAAASGEPFARIVGHAGPIAHLMSRFTKPGTTAHQLALGVTFDEAVACVIDSDGRLMHVVLPTRD